MAMFAPLAVPAVVLALTVPAAWAGVDGPSVLWIGVFGCLIGYAVAVDLVERRIPNALTYPGTVAMFIVAGIVGPAAFLAALSGALLALGISGVAWWFGRGSLGLGDVKFSAMVGAFLGASGVIPYLLFGTATGALLAVAIVAAGRGRRATFAYGPALAVGAILTLYASSFATAVG